MGAAGRRIAGLEFLATRWPRRRGRRHTRLASLLELARKRRLGGSSFVGTVRRRVAGAQTHARRAFTERRTAERRGIGTAPGTPWVRAADRSSEVLAAGSARSECAVRTQAQRSGPRLAIDPG